MSTPETDSDGAVTRAEYCVIGCAEAWRGDGEIVVSPMGLVPMVGARLARATFSPDILLTDGEATLIRGVWPIGGPLGLAEGWLPFRSVFDVVWHGVRHVMMGASQIDRYGNTNISCIGDFRAPSSQLLGARGAPGNTVNHPTSYWIPSHSPRVFVEKVDMVSGIGYDRAAAAGGFIAEHHELRRVVTNLGVFDFESEDHAMRLRSVHPGVSVDEVVAATGFELVIADEVPETRRPSDEELVLIRQVIDPKGQRETELGG